MFKVRKQENPAYNEQFPVQLFTCCKREPLQIFYSTCIGEIYAKSLNDSDVIRLLYV